MDRNFERMMDMWAELLDEIGRAPSMTTQFRRPHRDVDVNEENGVLTITAEMAGIEEEAVDIEVSNRTVTIKGKSDRKDFNWSNTFAYDLDPESAEAAMVNGILDVTIAKLEKTSAVKVKVNE